MKLLACFNRILVPACLVLISHANADAQSDAPHVAYADASHSTLLLDVAGKHYVVDVAAGSVREAGTQASTPSSPPSTAAAGLFRQNCASCHGTDGKGTRSAGTP